MQVGEQVPQLLLTYGIAKGGHHAMSVQNDKGDALVVGRKAAGQVILFEERLKARPVQRAGVVGAMTAGAVVDEDRCPRNSCGVSSLTSMPLSLSCCKI